MKLQIIQGYRDYTIDMQGVVYSSYYGTKKPLKQHNHKGYMRVALCRENKRKMYFVHRLVAEAFIPNPDSKPQVNHIDGNKQNNCVSNLEWCSREENEKHKREILGWDSKGKKNGHHNYSISKCYPSHKLRNKLVELGIPRWKHNLAELGEMLGTESNAVMLSGIGKKWIFGFANEFDVDITSDTEADARAKMLIYLIENKLINL